MNLALDESQRILVDTFAEFFARECPPTQVRQTESEGFSPELWAKLAGLGAPAMGLPERVGGIDASMLELGLVSAACGRALAPLPLAEVVSAGRLLVDRSGQEPLLRDIAGGEALVSPVLDADARDALRRTLVPAGRVAKHAVGLAGDTLCLWSAPAELHGPERVPIDELGAAAHAFWALDDCDVHPLERGDAARRAFARATSEWKLLTAFALVGLAQQALAIGAEYARTREQFGAPIGRFQAVAHPLADCATRAEGAELLVYEAAWAESEDPQRFEELCSMAFIFAAQTAQQTTAASLHTHGGYGVTLEYDIQLFHRRAHAWALVGGGARNELLTLADMRLDAASAGVGGR